jgi:hypothetical protein
MAGLANVLVVARTDVGRQGTAGAWPSPRGVRGVITQSAPMGDSRHSALMSLVNVTFVGFTGGQLWALEACGKCKAFQGGATTWTAGLVFIQPGKPALATWWAHAGSLRAAAPPRCLRAWRHAAGSPASAARLPGRRRRLAGALKPPQLNPPPPPPQVLGPPGHIPGHRRQPGQRRHAGAARLLAPRPLPPGRARRHFPLGGGEPAVRPGRVRLRRRRRRHLQARARLPQVRADESRVPSAGAECWGARHKGAASTVTLCSTWPVQSLVLPAML